MFVYTSEVSGCRGRECQTGSTRESGVRLLKDHCNQKGGKGFRVSVLRLGWVRGSKRNETGTL